MDFDEGWRRLEKILLWGGVFFSVVGVSGEGDWFGKFYKSIFIIGFCFLPYFGSKGIKWIVDGFRGKNNEDD